MAIDEALELANNGDIAAMLELGIYYFDQSEYDNAQKWYKSAAELGSPIGMIQTSRLMRMMAYAKRKLGGADAAMRCIAENEEALRWAKLAADNGIENVDAESILAEMGVCNYLMAIEDDENSLTFLQEAERLFNEAEGFMSPQYEMYQAFTIYKKHQNGIPLDSAEERKMFSLLKECSTKSESEVPNLDVVFLYLGIAYLEGRGCVKDDNQAHDAFIRANELGMECEDIIGRFKKKFLGGWEFRGF